MSNSTLNRVEFKMSIQNSTWQLIYVEWFRILRQFLVLHEILEYSFNVEIIWINLFQMLNCLFTSIFLIQSKLSIFFWILLMTLLSTNIYNHYCWNWALILAFHSTYWLFSLNIIIINLYILMTSIRSTHEKLYAIYIEWTKFSEVENHSQSIQLLHAVETVSFETMYQICSR